MLIGITTSIYRILMKKGSKNFFEVVERVNKAGRGGGKMTSSRP